MASLFCEPRKRADQIVGFEARDAVDWNQEAGEDVAHHLDLRSQVIWHRAAARFVLDVFLGAPTSKAATAYSGRDARTIASIDVKPYAALVTCPSEVLIGGSAKKAR